MSVELVTMIMFGGLMLGLMLGLPLAFCLGGVAVMVSYHLWGFAGLYRIVMNTFGSMWNIIFVAIPLFIFMGILLQRAGIAEDLFEMMHRWSGRVRGGMAMGTVIICAIFAAMTGLTGAATVTMGLVAVPAMLKRGYNKDIALGTVAGAGTLGILIPPSISFILLAVIGQLSVGKLFMAGVGPGLLLIILFIAYIGVRAWLNPKLCPAHPEKFTLRQKITSTRAVILPLLIILAVLGSIFLGIATPTEASALGAASTLIAVAIHRRFTWQVIKEAVFETFKINGMVMWIVFGAICFSATFTGMGGIRLVNEIMMELEVSRWLILGGIILIIFFLGMFIDPSGIVFIAAPIGFPVIKALGFDPVWFGVLFVIGLQVGYLTPPFGYNLFYLKATAPPGITLADIYHCIWPFLGILIIGMAIVMLFPQIALWLPEWIMQMRG